MTAVPTGWLSLDALVWQAGWAESMVEIFVTRRRVAPSSSAFSSSASWNAADQSGNSAEKN